MVYLRRETLFPTTVNVTILLYLLYNQWFPQYIKFSDGCHEKNLEDKVRFSKFPKMVSSKCGHSFMNDEQAAYYELGDGEGAVGERGGKAIRGYLIKN